MTAAIDSHCDAFACEAEAWVAFTTPRIVHALVETPSVPQKLSSVELTLDPVARGEVHPLDEIVDFDAFMEELEADPEMVEHLREANRLIADTYYADEGDTFRTLRLRAGLSQMQLAKAIGTSQPHIARIESGATNDLKSSTLRKLASALDVDVGRLDAALRATESMAGRSA